MMIGEAMKKYIITYWNNGDIRQKTVEAENIKEAQYQFYMSTACDDIKEIKEVTDDVL